MTTPDPEQIARGLTKAMRAALLWFTPGGFVCSFRHEWIKLSGRAYKQMHDLGLLESHWTWASTTRPDTGLTPLGLAVRNIVKDQPND